MDIPVLVSQSFENLPQVERVIDSVNREQSHFRLSLVTADWIPDGGNKKWIDQYRLFPEIEKRLGNEPACVIVQNPLKLDFFSDYKPGVYIFSTADWNTKYAPPPLETYLIYMLACGLVDLACELPEEVGDSVLHDPPIGCISDYNSDKSSIRFSMMNAHICEACKSVLLAHGLQEQALNCTEEILSFVRTAMKPYIKTVFMFIAGQPVSLEETLYAEFKEVISRKPAEKITKEAEEYAIAFLNREGGRIFWGIRDGDRVVDGVRLDHSQRDAIRRWISERLAQIQPSRSQTDFHLEIHPVRDEHGLAIADLNVVELAVAPGNPEDLYATSGGDVWVKTPGGTQKLSYNQKVAEIRRRSRETYNTSGRIASKGT
jgi:Putative DNA-binding domain